MASLYVGTDCLICFKPVTGEAVASLRQPYADLVRREAPRLIAHFEEYPEASSLDFV